MAACVDAVLAPRLIGRDPTEPVRIWEELYAFSRDFGQRGSYIEAISAIDIALWDIAGQAAGLPVWKLLGGRSQRVRAYASTGTRLEAAARADSALQLRQQGFPAL